VLPIALCALVPTTTVLASPDPNFRVLLDEAEKQARQVSDRSAKVLLLHNIALYRARTGQVAEAKSLIKELESDSAKGYVDDIYESMAPQLVRGSDLDAALQAAQQAGQRGEEALYAVAEELLRQGRVEDANRVMERTAGTPFKYRRARVIFGLAGASASQGRKADVGVFLDRAAAMISSDLSAKSGLQTGTVELALSIAAQRRACGDVASADKGFSTVQAAVSTVGDQGRKEQYLYLVAAAAAEGGDYGLAQRTLDAITDPMRRTQASEAIARAQLASGQLHAAANTAVTIPGLEARINVLLLLAQAQAKSDTALARKTLDSVAESLESASGGFDDSKAWATANLASVEYQIGDRKRAAKLWQRAIKESERFTIHPDRERPSLIRYVAQLQAQAGEEKAALATAKRLGDDGFSRVAYAEGASGKVETALKWIPKQKNPATRANALLDLVMGAVPLREPPRQSQFNVTECK
jgi:tetratricopeptide (TPR) repeat protein